MLQFFLRLPGLLLARTRRQSRRLGWFETRKTCAGPETEIGQGSDEHTGDEDSGNRGNEYGSCQPRAAHSPPAAAGRIVENWLVIGYQNLLQAIRRCAVQRFKPLAVELSQQFGPRLPTVRTNQYCSSTGCVR